VFNCDTSVVGLVFDLGGTYVDLGWDLSRVDFNPSPHQSIIFKCISNSLKLQYIWVPPTQTDSFFS